MMSGSSQSHPHQPPAVWPWIVMPAVVLIVFCVLHYDVRPMANPHAAAATPSALASGAATPADEPSAE
jgi:H+/Cl- antiporter ClcA